MGVPGGGGPPSSDRVGGTGGEAGRGACLRSSDKKLEK